jgi:hypothetical protein
MKQTRIPPKKAKRKQSPRHGPGRLTMKRWMHERKDRRLHSNRPFKNLLGLGLKSSMRWIERQFLALNFRPHAVYQFKMQSMVSGCK